MNRSNLEKIEGLDIIGEGGRKAYFFKGQVIAMEDTTGVVAIIPTQDEEVSEVFNEMLLETPFEHYVKDGKNYIVDGDNQRTEMTEHFALRVKETL